MIKSTVSTQPPFVNRTAATSVGDGDINTRRTEQTGTERQTATAVIGHQQPVLLLFYYGKKGICRYR